MINWKVRIRNKAFWVAFIPALLLLMQSIAAAFGWELDLSDLGNKMLAIVNQLFALLAIIGIINDPTTNGLDDSTQAMYYDYPKVSLPERDDD